MADIMVFKDVHTFLNILSKSRANSPTLECGLYLTDWVLIEFGKNNGVKFPTLGYKRHCSFCFSSPEWPTLEKAAML